ncbi:MAG: hypothetical protein ACLQLH_09715 [Terracidiphilus sp.]
MKRLLMLPAILLAYTVVGTAQYHPAPTYHPPAPTYHPPAYHAPAYHAPAYHAPRSTPAPRQSTPRQSQSRTNNPRPNNTQRNADRNQRNAQRNADRDKRNADRNQRNANRNAAKAHANSIKQQNKATRARNKQLHSENRAARGAFRNGRFNARYFGSHFGRNHLFGFCGAGRFWMGSPYASDFWFGGVEFAFGPGMIWPGAWGRCDEFYVDYIDGVGYALVDPAYADVTLPLAVDIDAQPMDEPDQQ